MKNFISRRLAAAAVSAVFLVKAAIPGAPAVGAPPLPAPRPNVVLLFSDDAGYGDMGFTAAMTGIATEFKTPRLDALAAQSVYATHAYVTSPICAVSRAGLLTGRYPQRFGFHFNALEDDIPYEGVPTSETLLFEELKTQGYATGLIGKWHLGEQPQWTPNARGVDYFFGMLQAADYYYYSPHTNRVRRNDALVNWGAESSFNNFAPDPTSGRYLTDAFADEASQFIATRAGQAEPFFLMASFTAPHSPYQAKAQDLAAFNGTSLTGFRKTVAAQTYALDRAVGAVLDRLDDPNGDGDLSDSIADNTIVVFANDNGGQFAYASSNAPLAGWKGTGYEGGIRVPLLVRGGGLAPGRYDQQVSTLDLYPTLLSLAGGIPGANLDGVDLLPYLSGADSGAPHQYLFQHNRVNFSSVQDEQWKLVKPQAGSHWQLFRLRPDGSGETVDVLAEFPEKVAELTRAFVDWEVSTEKAINTTAVKHHPGDVFTFRNDLSPIAYWQNSLGWLNEQGVATSISREDLTANFVAVLTTNSTRDYASMTNISRAASHHDSVVAAGYPDLPGLGEAMMNELRLTGSYVGAGGHTATLSGNTLMLVDSPAGRPAQIGLHAVKANPAKSYKFLVNNDLVLYDDLHLTGDGDVEFELAGQLRDFYAPSSVIKQGSSVVRLTGDNRFSGGLDVQGGRVEISGANAWIDHATALRVRAGAEYRQLGGQVAFDQVQIDPGAVMTISGGQFETEFVRGNLTNSGAEFALGPTTGVALIDGDYTQTSGSLLLEIAGTQAGVDYDQLVVFGSFTAGGSLVVDLIDGFVPSLGSAFQLLEWSSFDGAFAAVALPALTTGLAWDASDLQTTGWLRVKSTTAPTTQTSPADFDGDNDVDANDLAVWQSTFGIANGDGRVTGRDFLLWQREYDPAQGALHAVPEPTSIALGGVIVLVIFPARRALRNLRRPDRAGSLGTSAVTASSGIRVRETAVLIAFCVQAAVSAQASLVGASVESFDTDAGGFMAYRYEAGVTGSPADWQVDSGFPGGHISAPLTPSGSRLYSIETVADSWGDLNGRLLTVDLHVDGTIDENARGRFFVGVGNSYFLTPLSHSWTPADYQPWTPYQVEVSNASFEPWPFYPPSMSLGEVLASGSAQKVVGLLLTNSQVASEEDLGVRGDGTLRVDNFGAISIPETSACAFGAAATAILLARPRHRRREDALVVQPVENGDWFADQMQRTRELPARQARMSSHTTTTLRFRHARREAKALACSAICTPTSLLQAVSN